LATVKNFVINVITESQSCDKAVKTKNGQYCEISVRKRQRIRCCFQALQRMNV